MPPDANVAIKNKEVRKYEETDKPSVDLFLFMVCLL